METLRFLTPALARHVVESFSSPTFVYDQATLEKNALAALAFPHAFGLTVRYAMKASPNAAILQVFDSMGLHIDASSGYEVRRALAAGIAPERISLSTQELPEDFCELYELGIRFNACSLSQLEALGRWFPGSRCGVRFNPGLGSGGTGKTNVGGPHSSFGIWHAWADEVAAVATQHQIQIVRIHTHIGSGSDPQVWARVAGMSLDLVRRFEQVETLNLGGGYKVGRMRDEVSTDLMVIGEPVKAAFEQLATTTGRQVKLEIEPGTFLVANAASLVTKIQDVVSTGGPDGVTFLKLNAGMTEILRPSLYAAQHPIVVVPENDTGQSQEYIVVGHCCESGDILTPAPDDPETLLPRRLTTAIQGDLCVIEGVGAYCAGMAAKNYNSFPEAAEVILNKKGELHLIRKRQTLEQIIANEVPLPL